MKRRNPTIDETIAPRWRDCEFCGTEFYDTGTFLTERHHWLQMICDECKRGHQMELREEVALGTPQLAHLLDARVVVLRGYHPRQEIGINAMPRVVDEKHGRLVVTLADHEGTAFSFVVGPEQAAALSEVLRAWLETGRLKQPVLPKEEK